MSPRSRLNWFSLLGLITAACAAQALGQGDAPAAAPANGASKPPAVVAPELTTLEANGFQISLDIHGFRQDLGYERITRSYFRMAVFSTTDEQQREFGGGLIFSLLVDDLPKGVMDLKDLSRHFIMANKLAPRLKDGSLIALKCPQAVSGVLFRYPQRLPTPADFPAGSPPEYTLWHWYFESIQNGRWFEIHFSRGVVLNAPVPDGIEEAINRILSSLQFPTVTSTD